MSLYRNEKLFSLIAWKWLKITRVIKTILATESLVLETLHDDNVSLRISD